MEKIQWFCAVIRPMPRLYALVRGCITRSSEDASASYQRKPRAGYVSLTIVIVSYHCYVCVVIRGYILHMYRKCVRTT